MGLCTNIEGVQMHYLPENNDVMLGRCLAPPSCCPLQAAAPQPRWVVGRATDGQRQTTDGGERGQLPGQAELLESKLLQAVMEKAAPHYHTYSILQYVCIGYRVQW